MDQLTFRAGSSIRRTGGTVHQVVEVIQHPDFDYDAHDFDAEGQHFEHLL